MDAEYVIVNKPRGTGSIKVTWNVPQGYTLLAIEFPDSDGQMSGCMSEGPLHFSCNDIHTKAGVYKYTIKVKDVTPYDPWMVND